MVEWLHSLGYFALVDKVVDKKLESQLVKEACDENEDIINPSMTPTGVL